MIDKIRYLNVEVRTLVDFLNPFAVTLNLELQENVTLHLVQNHNIIGIVLVFSCADFHLLEIAKIIVLRTESKFNSGVKEVDELRAAGKVVLGDWLPSSALGRVSYDDGGQEVSLLGPDEFHHKAARRCTLFGVVADECDVVVQNAHSVPETPSYGTELTLGAQNSLLWYAKCFLRHSV